MKIKLFNLFFGGAIYFLCILLVSVFWRIPLFLLSGILIINVVIFIKWHKKSDFVYYFVAFFLGSIGEIIAIYFGAWQYSKPFYLIPIWLPFLWGTAGLLLIKMSRTLNKE